MSKKRKSQNASKNLTIKDVNFFTDKQADIMDAWDDGKHLIMSGVAGTGKTFLALYLALEYIFEKTNPSVKKVYVYRSAVATRDQGFLKGDKNEKMEAYEKPYVSLCNEIFDCGTAYEELKAGNNIEFESTSYNRGITLDNAVVIIDEVQNMTDSEIHTMLTRIGKNTKLIICGDYRQDDLKQNYHKHRQESGFSVLLDIASKMNEFEHFAFGVDDIVRSGFVKSYLTKRHELGY